MRNYQKIYTYIFFIFNSLQSDDVLHVRDTFYVTDDLAEWRNRDWE